ncbi:CoA protein activase [Carboxydothermus ferrireducens]|uniref:Nucleotide-binding protein (Sugar kinase/HSP70/actin superfamily) n=1 Tax=Carboxydothermus ferrireducens DSM 11255 TaxID=1119529 RepID=A0ABX2RBV6_9THEO|nr:CoA protein activase [Carboxydothermus ferrireducens]NYE58666.1 putative nucleotide-binding protein (sugar kinase/HSP70/actin superfamily) [Carboxydothermus ferrireducens DSM 11255]
MKVTYPHMGNMAIGVKAMLEELGVEVVLPPPITKKTLTLGTKYGPEFACLPLKLNLGNFIEAYELGADTILMAGGTGPCRFGYYAYVEQEILKELGINYDLLVLEPPERNIMEFIAKLKKITGNKPIFQVIRAVKKGFLKIKAADEIEKKVAFFRAREITKGATDRVWQEFLQNLNRAREEKEIEEAVNQAVVALARIPMDLARKVLKIGVVGEIFTLLEPFTNFNIERYLGNLGVEVQRTIYLSEWVNDHLFLGLFKNYSRHKEIVKEAPPFLCHFVGGHGQETVGGVKYLKKQGFDGVIQLLPFTCMPEIVAQAVLPAVSEVEDIPVLSLVVDEHTGEAGFITRLEAFCDLLSFRQKGGNHEKRRISGN